MKTSLRVLLLVAMLLAPCSMHRASAQGGNLNPTGIPAPSMRSFQELWDKMSTLEGTLTGQQIQIKSVLKQDVTLLQQNALLLENAGIELLWHITTVDTSCLGESPSLAFSPGGQPSIIYTDTTEDFFRYNLKYAVFDGSTWTPYFAGILDSFSPRGYLSSLAFTPDGDPAIAYMDIVGDSFHYLLGDRVDWSGEFFLFLKEYYTEDAGYPSLAFTPGGQPAISYYTFTNGDLRCAVFDGTDWSNTTVDSTGDVGYYNSLAFTPGGQPAISYYDETNGALKYAVFDGSTWTYTMVDNSAGGAGRENSLAFTPGGQPAISYESGDGLKYAVFNGNTWTITIVDGAGHGPTSLAFTPGGQPAIGYEGSDGLKYAVFNGNTWTITTVDSTDTMGESISLAFTPDGQPAIAYDDVHGVKYAVRKLFINR